MLPGSLLWKPTRKRTCRNRRSTSGCRLAMPTLIHDALLATAMASVRLRPQTWQIQGASTSEAARKRKRRP
eukprot:10889093-Alexandrium_andersonii.AAC.1